MTYSLDFRKKVFAIKASEKLSFIETAERFNIGVTTLVRWSKRLAPLTKRTKPATKINMDVLKKDIETYPDAYQYERAKRLGVSTTGIWHALKRLNVSYKKTLQHPKGDPAKRFTFCQHLEAFKQQKRPLVFIDESGFAHDMPRTHGYARRGQRCYGQHDWGAKGRTNIIGAFIGRRVAHLKPF